MSAPRCACRMLPWLGGSGTSALHRVCTGGGVSPCTAGAGKALTLPEAPLTAPHQGGGGVSSLPGAGGIRAPTAAWTGETSLSLAEKDCPASLLVFWFGVLRGPCPHSRLGPCWATAGRDRGGSAVRLVVFCEAAPLPPCPALWLERAGFLLRVQAAGFFSDRLPARGQEEAGKPPDARCGLVPAGLVPLPPPPSQGPLGLLPVGARHGLCRVGAAGSRVSPSSQKHAPLSCLVEEQKAVAWPLPGTFH